MNSLVRVVDTALRMALCLLMALMLIDVCWQVISRYLLMKPSSYTEEIARFLLIWISFLGGSYAYRRRMHLGIDFLTEKFSSRGQRSARMFSYCVCGLFALLVMVIGGAQLTLLAWELRQVSGALGVPMAYIYSVIPISGVFMMFYTVYFMVADRLQVES